MKRNLSVLALLCLLGAACASAQTATPLCGVVSDGANHVPDDTTWHNFTPPAVGSAFTYPIGGGTGCTVTRLTNSVGGGTNAGQWVPFYAIGGVMSANDLYLLLTNGDAATKWEIIDKGGNVVISTSTFGALGLNNNSLPKWDLTDDLSFYGTVNNIVKKCTITLPHSVACVTKHTFTEYPSTIWFPGDSDMNANGWIPVSGQATAGSTVQLFLYQPSTDTKSAVAYTSTCTGNNSSQPNGDCIHRTTVTPGNGLMIASNDSSGMGNGDFFWEPGMASPRLIEGTQQNHNVPGYEGGPGGPEVIADEALSGYFNAGGGAISPCTPTYTPSTALISPTATANQARECLLNVAESNWHVSWTNASSSQNGAWVAFSQEAKNCSEWANNDTASITSFSITTNVVTIVAANTWSNFNTCSKVIISGLSVGTYLNGQVLNVTGRTPAQITANFTHADVGSTTDSGTASRYIAPSQTGWAIYDNEILLVRSDASGLANRVYRLTMSMSREQLNYFSEPHAWISRSGRYIVFESNAGWNTSGCGSDGSTNDCGDTYIIGPLFSSAMPNVPAPVPIFASAPSVPQASAPAFGFVLCALGLATASALRLTKWPLTPAKSHRNSGESM